MSDIVTGRSSGILRVELNRPAKKNAKFHEHSHARRGRIGLCRCR
jgi:hypothetical protein